MKENNNYYWTEQHQQAIEEYFYCITATTSGQTRTRILGELYKPFRHLASVTLYSCNIPFSDSYKDYIQDIVMHLIENVIPRVNVDKLQAFLKFAHTSVRNYIIIQLIIKKNTKYRKSTYVELDSESLYDDNQADSKIIQFDNQVQIIQRIDQLINQQRILNKSNTIFLLLLRQYLIENDYDARGFDVYVMRVMKIKKSTLAGICSRLKISTRIFNDKINNKD